jgi:uncharacterized protein
MFIDGPAGALEVSYVEADDAIGGAVLCHPHPQYGGSMLDQVLEEVAGACHDARYATVRFNFRGVGNSDGRYDGGAGETLDALAVADWLTTRHSSVIIAGYSFGAIVALRAAATRPFGKTILIAPPTSMLPDDVADDALAIFGDRDDFVDVTVARSRFPRAVEISGADHFFAGYGAEIRRAIDGYVGVD